jgi:tRNA pseudouridine55 synthase
MGLAEYKFEEGEILLFNKPLYWTSFDLVNKVRKEIAYNYGLKKLKVGHAGTLDPLATGLMVICTGKATKKIDEFRDLAKEYIATIRFGETTPSFDMETNVDKEYPFEHITPEMVKDVLEKFKGEQMQEPPLFSAKFVDGKRAYELARKKVEKTLDKVKVTFHEIELIEFEEKTIKTKILCSKGTYIRAFARDIGIALGSGAHLTGLVRTAIGEKRLEQALSLDDFRFILEQTKQKN